MTAEYGQRAISPTMIATKELYERHGRGPGLRASHDDAKAIVAAIEGGGWKIEPESIGPRSIRMVMVRGPQPWSVALAPGERIVNANHEGQMVWVYIEGTPDDC